MYCGAPVKEDTTDPTLPSGTENEEPSSEAAGSSNKKKKVNVAVIIAAVAVIVGLCAVLLIPKGTGPDPVSKEEPAASEPAASEVAESSSEPEQEKEAEVETADIIEIADPVLKKEIQKELGITGREITEDDVEKLTELRCSDQ